jgi:hypothetical protein
MPPMHYLMQLEQVKQTDLNKSWINKESNVDIALPRKSGVKGNETGNGLAIGCAIIVSSVFGSGKRS